MGDIHSLRFPSEAEQLRRRGRETQAMTAEQRLLAALDLLAAAETLSRAGDCRSEQLRLHENLEQEWRDRMKAFLDRHVPR